MLGGSNTGDISKFWQKAQKGFKIQSAAFGVEMAMTANEALAGWENPIEGALGMLQEVDSFTNLGLKTFENWEHGMTNATHNMFMGLMKDDEEIGQGISNFASLQHALEGGIWVDGLGSADAYQSAVSQYLAYALPMAEMMNDDVRPTIIIRPYACDDGNKVGQDKTFRNWVDKFASNVAVKLDAAPGLCFVVVDANKQAKHQSCGRGGCRDIPELAELSGINHASLDHPNGDSLGPWGDIKLEDYVWSAYTGWKNNGKKNSVPVINLEQTPGDQGGNIWDAPLNTAGEWSPFFVVCGNDDPNSSLDKKKTPEDIDLIFDNLWSAMLDVSVFQKIRA
ncbi:hypothetical protein BDV96DRAFT_605900 [Lophiotrema nucula]|uniref:Uncharacterized protein n=1 Tax=Lophiotrema nucula TaxID=690887 RepID=A0A6A5YMC1_9PLEO|nr:hypothetical protein BDV96DRAFT_605900 [Lophiotrema nucula]